MLQSEHLKGHMRMTNMEEQYIIWQQNIWTEIEIHYHDTVHPTIWKVDGKAC